MHANAIIDRLKITETIVHLDFHVFGQDVCYVLVCFSQVSQVDEDELNGEVWKPFEAWWVVGHRCIK